MKSTITQLSPVNTKKEEVIRSLHADRQTCESHLKKLQELFKTDSPQQIGQKLHNIIVRENVFNAIMNEVARSFEVTFDQAEVDAITKQLTPQFQYKPEYIQEIAKKVITKSLIFQSLAKEWNITVTDQDVNDSLAQFYKDTNESIRSYKEDSKKFEGVRTALFEEKVSSELLHRFTNIRLDQEAIRKQFEDAARRQKEMLDEQNKDKSKTN